MSFDPEFATRALRAAEGDGRGHAVILGAGATTSLTLHAVSPAARRSIHAVLDDDPRKSGQRVADLPVCLPAAYPTHRVGRVVITSEVHEAVLSRRARELFGPRAELLYTFDRDRSLPSRLHATADAIDHGWHADHGDDALWTAADRLRESLGRRLDATPTHRYGPRRQLDELRELDAALDGSFRWRDATVLNLGCGVYHPLGLSLLAWLAGAAATTALDAEPPVDAELAGRALLDLVAAVVTGPAPRPPLPDRTTCLARVEAAIDLERGLPDPRVLEHRVESLFDTTLPPGSIDLIASRDVFEHLEDVAGASRGAVAAAAGRPGRPVRRLRRPPLLSESGPLPPLVAPGRSRRADAPGHQPPAVPAVPAAVRRGRFGDGPLPAHRPRAVSCDDRARLAPIYREMSPDDLAVHRAVAVLRRPG